MSVHRGEVLGITGILGDGHSELFSTVFGFNGKNYSGAIHISGKERHPSSTHEALRYGLAYLPKNRKENGIISDMTSLDNGTVVKFPTYGKLGILNKKKQKDFFDEQVGRLRIKTSGYETLITKLSGGKGSLTGAFVGMLIIGVMNNVLNMLGVPTFLCDAVRGVIIILAVLVQRRDNAEDA